MNKSPRVKAPSLRVRMAELKSRHHDLKARIATELKRPLPCSVQLRKLKRRRLMIKDELARHEGLLRMLDSMPMPGKLGKPA
ncbi:YdcH family protein [Ruegeria sp. 2205SS24-7]|uniref:YdcH family protein n=1 Tax=Ruegeria discodermiae TaxID=3064389 RepID=UPI002740AE73|nr:YdcH family protein [Ruegeria sp. 2205SS24-7]MDP5215738.1 YdcH family protein [Ruegeria sp. 2205SS24-7]